MPALDPRLCVAREWAAAAQPYLSATLYALQPHCVPDGTFEEIAPLGTLGVTDRGVLFYEPRALARWTEAEIAAVLVHEVHHLVREHGARCAGREPRLWNVAGDLEINDDLRALRVPQELGGVALPLPKGGLFPERYKLPPGLMAEAYYEILRVNRPPPDGDPVPGGGACGSASGAPLPGEPQPGAHPGSLANAPPGLSDDELRAVVKITQGAIEAAAKGRAPGDVPAGLRRWVDEALRPPRVDWRSALRRLVSRSVLVRPGANEVRYTRMNRKQAGVGVGVGAPVLPGSVRVVPRVLVAIDTSGSMGAAELHAGLSEVRGVLRALDAPVRVVSCDCEVHEEGSAETVEQVAQLLRGGGGTSFLPVFDMIAASPQRPELVVFVTDGDGPAPAIPPHGVRVIWLLVGKHARVPAPWGKVIQVD